VALTAFTSSLAAGTRVDAILNKEAMLALADMTDLRSVVTFTPFDAAGSDTLTSPIITASYGMQAPGEGLAAAGPTTLGESSFDLTVARYSLYIEPTDIWQLTSGGSLDVAAVGQIVAGNAAIQFSDMLCALFPSVTAAVGATGTALTVDTVLAGVAALREANASGNVVAVLHHQQVTDFVDSLRAEVGPLQWVPASAEMISAKPPGYVGRWQGVDFYSVDSCVAINTDADWSGCIFTEQAFRYTEGPIGKLTPNIDRDIVAGDSSIFVTRVWDDVLGTFRIIGSYYPGVSIAQQGAAVEVISAKT